MAAKPYFPAIHLMSYYREEFGYREGQFPVCEDIAARSIAIPFFPQMTEGQVARVGEAAHGPCSPRRGRTRRPVSIARLMAPSLMSRFAQSHRPTPSGA